MTGSFPRKSSLLSVFPPQHLKLSLQISPNTHICQYCPTMAQMLRSVITDPSCSLGRSLLPVFLLLLLTTCWKGHTFIRLDTFIRCTQYKILQKFSSNASDLGVFYGILTLQHNYMHAYILTEQITPLIVVNELPWTPQIKKKDEWIFVCETAFYPTIKADLYTVLPGLQNYN